jgi:hypothetical protein
MIRADTIAIHLVSFSGSRFTPTILPAAREKAARKRLLVVQLKLLPAVHPVPRRDP